METRADHLPSGNSSAPATAYPPWILLGEYFFGGHGDTDTKTVAHARTAKGRPISISFVLATPPAVSRLRLDSPGMPQLDGHNVHS
jgi:alkylation response protein AidB-like acyl-CoA dehydrogenase